MSENEKLVEQVGLAKELRDACFGHPAKIAWPHRILHRAADALELADMRETVALQNRQKLKAALTAAEGRIKALEAERDGARAVLAGLSSFFGAGLGDDTTTAEQFDRRIREGVEITYAPMVEAWRKEIAQ